MVQVGGLSSRVTNRALAPSKISFVLLITGSMGISS